MIKNGSKRALGAMIFGAIAYSGATMAQDLPSCARYPVGEATYACQCPASDSTSSVWGTGIYTADSDICTAARHSGLIDVSGGGVLAVAEDGRDGYEDSLRHGIQSRSWGAYGNSFSFDPKGPRFVTASTLEACGRFDTALEQMQCSCSAGVSSGAVWGSGPYTADSDICAAAEHAGVLGGQGGDVMVMRFSGLDGYVGSERHEVTTRDWGAYGTSIIINTNGAID